MTHDQMIEEAACNICGKIKGLPTDKCFTSYGQSNPLCNEYGRCRIDEKSEDQLRYALEKEDQSIFLKACPGSGKTEVVGLRAAYEIIKLGKSPGGIAVLTFTNNAADVIKRRVSQFVGVEKAGFPHFIGTIDSWLHSYISHPFGYFYTGFEGIDGDYSIRIIDSSSSAVFLNSYKAMNDLNRTGNVLANQYFLNYETGQYEFSSGNRRDNTRNSASLVRGQIDALNRIKSRFLKAGFATYQDIENISYELLENREGLADFISNRFPMLIIDECQDLSWIQLEILKKIKDAGSKLHFVGDLNQAIYEFKKVDPEKVAGFVADNYFTEISLKENFRSCQPIVDICQKIVDDGNEFEGKREQIIDNSCICVIYEDGQMKDLPVWFKNFIESKSLSTKDSAIITRSWKNVSRLRSSGNNDINKFQLRLAMAIYLWGLSDVQVIEDAIKYIGRFVANKFFGTFSSNSRQYYCPECVNSSIKWRLFLADLLEKCCKDSSLSNLDQFWSVWVVNVKNNFGDIIRSCQELLDDALTEKISPFPNLTGSNFRVLSGLGSTAVKQSLPESITNDTRVRITTIHSVKGETLDAIMLVSAPTKQGSNDNHWEHWLGDVNPEAKRLAYVASSRPKHLLVWAVSKGNNGEMARLTDLGFVPLNLNEDASGSDIRNNND